MRSPLSGLEDRNATTLDDIYEEARDFLKLVIDAEADNRSRGIQALKFRDGDQWPQTLYQERELDGRLSLTVNHTNTFVSRVENSMRQQRPRIKCHPVSDTSVDKAQIVNGIVRHVENRSQASIAYDTGGRSALNIGWGYWRLVPEYMSEQSFDQDLRILPIPNAFTVYRDPHSFLPDGSDSMRYIVSEKIKRIEYKSRYPKAENVDWIEGGSGDDLDWESLDEIRLAEYFRIVDAPERLFKMKDGTTRYESDFAKGHLERALKDPDTYNFDTERKDGKSVAVERTSTKRQVEWYRLNGRKVVDQRVLPPSVRHIPIVAVEGDTVDINGKKYRSGMVKNLMEPARMVNYWETMKTERLALAPKAEWTAYEGVIQGHPEWHDANRKSYSVLVGKAITGPNGEDILPLPTKTQPAAVETGMSEAMQSAYSALMAIAGQPHDPGQDAQGEVVSGVALAERRELSDVSHFQYYDNLTRSIAFTGTLILEWIPVCYSNERQQRIIGEDGVPQMVKINAKDENPSERNDLSIGTYDIVMDTGPGYDTKRQEGAETLMGLLQGPMGELIAQKGPDLILRGLDTAVSEQLADRLMIQVPDEMQKIMQSLPDRAQNIIKTLMQSNQQLTQQLQSAQMDIKHGLTKTLHQEATKLQVEHLKDKRAERDTRTNDDTKRFDTEFKGHTAIKVAEINQGGDILKSHVDHGHEMELADKMAEHAAQAEKSDKPN